MKKLLLMFLLASVSCFAQNVKIATPSAPSQNILSGITVNSSTNMVVPGSLTVSNEFILPKSAANNFIWTCTNANGAGTWLVNSGTNSIPGSVVLTNNVLFLNAITNVTSVGGGTSLRNDVSNNIFFIKSLLGSNGVSIVDGGSNVTISVTNSSGASSVLSTNLTTATGGSVLYNWSTILQITTTATSGSVIINARSMAPDPPPAMTWIRVRDATSNVVFNAHNGLNTGGGIASAPLLTEVMFVDTLSGSTKTYFMDVAASAINQPYTNKFTTSTQSPTMTNGLGMTMIQIP